MITPLGHQTTTRSPGSYRLAADQVRALTFRRPPFPHRGYDESQVDSFITWVADSLDRGEVIPVEKLQHVHFEKAGLRRRGYDEGDVDAFLRIVGRVTDA